MPDLTPETVAELGRLLAEATPGPWEHDPSSSSIGHPTEFGDGEWDDFVCESLQDYDADLIVAAVNALPALLAERERLRAERDELLQRCGQAIAFVQTGGPLFTKDRLELLAILYHAAPDGAEGAPDA